MLPSIACAGAIVCAAALAWPAIASAHPTKVALIQREGDADLDRAVAEALEDSELDVASGKQVARTLERLGLERPLSDHDVARLAAELEVDAVVEATFDRRAHKLRFTVFVDGKKVKRFGVPVDHARGVKFRARVRAAVLAKVAAAVPAPDRREPPTSKARTPEGREGAVADDDPDPAAKPTPGKPPVEPSAASAEDRDADAAAAVPQARARFDPPPRAAHRAEPFAARAELGMSMSGRTLSFQTTALARPPAPYQNAPVPGARFEAELYPLAVLDPASPASPASALAGLGIAGEFDQTVALTLHASAEMAVPLHTTQRHYAVGVRYRIALGHTPTSPVLTAGAGYGARTFVVDRTGLMNRGSLDLPDVDYRLFDPGLALRVPITGRLALTLGGRALLVTSAGPIQRADQYGQAKVYGGTGSAGIELLLADRFALRLAGEATQLSLRFSGAGTLATSRDGDASTVDVRGATDRYYGGAATLAVVY